MKSEIEAHIFIAFLAHCPHVTPKWRLHVLATGLTPRSALEKFAAVQARGNANNFLAHSSEIHQHGLNTVRCSVGGALEGGVRRSRMAWDEDTKPKTD